MPAAEPHIVAHFVLLSVIMSDHGGDLASYMAASGSSDVVVTMPVTMDVVGRGTQSFFVAVAVTWHFDSAEPLQDARPVPPTWQWHPPRSCLQRVDQPATPWRLRRSSHLLCRTTRR